MAENNLVHILGPIIFPNMDMCRNTANNINFYYITNSVKINEKFFNKLKKPCFWTIFLILGAKSIFLEIQLCHAQFHVDF